MFTLKIDTDNDAFAADGAQEVARILRAVAGNIELGHYVGPVRDINGNRVGTYHFAPPDPR